jgi:hypothetical protein
MEKKNLQITSNGIESSNGSDHSQNSEEKEAKIPFSDIFAKKNTIGGTMKECKEYIEHYRKELLI